MGGGDQILWQTTSPTPICVGTPLRSKPQGFWQLHIWYLHGAGREQWVSHWGRGVRWSVHNTTHPWPMSEVLRFEYISGKLRSYCTHWHKMYAIKDRENHHAHTTLKAPCRTSVSKIPELNVRLSPTWDAEKHTILWYVHTYVIEQSPAKWVCCAVPSLTMPMPTPTLMQTSTVACNFSILHRKFWEEIYTTNSVKKQTYTNNQRQRNTYIMNNEAAEAATKNVHLFFFACQETFYRPFVKGRFDVLP